MAERKTPVILAMKGLPCTGKSKWARSLSAIFHWPVIDQDDVHSSVCKMVLNPSPSLQQIDDFCFKFVCEMARAVMAGPKEFARWPRQVIIDSPLSSRTHVDQLLKLAHSFKGRLIIVECIAKDEFEWRSWLNPERRGIDVADQCPHKPYGWDDLQMLLQTSGECWNYDIPDVSKLLVDTSDVCIDDNIVGALEELFSTDTVLEIDYVEWMVNKLQDPRNMTEKMKEGLKKTPQIHMLYPSTDENIHHTCEKCREPISTGPSYKCCACELQLHKSCAEFHNDLVIFPGNDPPYLSSYSDEYSFPVVEKCKFCNEENKDFSLDCSGCLFQSHIRSESLPTVLQHEGHKHPLFLKICPISADRKFRCRACGETGSHMGYLCSNCRFSCHVSCAFAPKMIVNNYHLHSLERSYSYKCDPSEAFYCYACTEEMKPNYWMYCCNDCNNFICHLNCKSFSE